MDVAKLCPSVERESGECAISAISELSPLTAGMRKLRKEQLKGVDNPRYVEALADAETFLQRWGAQAQALGWQADDLFRLHSTAPLARYDVMGLVWLLRGREVVAVTAQTATIRTASGGTLTYHRRLP
jgi:hypothetical protein